MEEKNYQEERPTHITKALTVFEDIRQNHSPQQCREFIQAIEESFEKYFETEIHIAENHLNMAKKQKELFYSHTPEPMNEDRPANSLTPSDKVSIQRSL